MTAFKAVHNYATDEVFLPARQCTLQNQHDVVRQPAQAQNETEHEPKEGDNAQSPMRGVTTKHLPENPLVVNVPMPVTAQQQEDTRVQERRLTARVLQVEEQETITGQDRVPLEGSTRPSA